MVDKREAKNSKVKKKRYTTPVRRAQDKKTARAGMQIKVIVFREGVRSGALTVGRRGQAVSDHALRFYKGKK